MKLSQFQFALPNDRIAQEPPRWRDECKLMVLNKKTGEIEHKLFKDIIEYFGKGGESGKDYKWSFHQEACASVC